MNRRKKRKLAKYLAASGMSPESAEVKIGIPARFVRAHARWQSKILARWRAHLAR